MAGGGDDFEATWRRAVAELRAILSSPVDLARVRAYCREHGGHDLAALSDGTLLAVVHMARMFDRSFPEVEREESKRWMETEGARLAASDPAFASLPN